MSRYESLGTDGSINFPLETQPKLFEEKQAPTFFLRKSNKVLVALQIEEVKKSYIVAGDDFCNECFSKTYASVEFFVLFVMVRKERIRENKYQCFGLCIRLLKFQYKDIQILYMVHKNIHSFIT